MDKIERCPRCNDKIYIDEENQNGLICKSGKCDDCGYIFNISQDLKRNTIHNYCTKYDKKSWDAGFRSGLYPTPAAITNGCPKDKSFVENDWLDGFSTGQLIRKKRGIID